MLMDKEFYINEIISKYDTNKIGVGGLLTYILDENNEKKELINFVKESLKINSVNNLKGFNSLNITFSVPEWLASFLNADFVVTDSFHGMVFSIIFEKDFIVIGNKERGLNRFISLLSLLGLENRLVYNITQMTNERLKKIDFKKINFILNENKEISFNFLRNSLE